MKKKMLTLSKFFITGIILVANVQSTSFTSASYNAGTNMLTITFSDSIYTDNILLGRMAFDDDNGGPRPDIIFSGGTVFAEDSLSSELQISLIYGGIIDQWGGRDIWGNNLTLVNALESLDLSSLQLVIEEGAFINNNAEPFTDADSNGYSSAEQFTDLNSNGTWDDAEEFADTNGNGDWDSAEVYTDAIGNDVWDSPEEFTDADSNGVWNDAEILFNDANGNGIWDPVELFVDADNNGVWFPGEELTDINGNNVWDDEEPFIDSNNNYVYDEAEPFVDFDGDNEFDQVSEEFTDLNNNGVWDPAEAFSDFGLDGITDTGDEGEGNNVWDFWDYPECFAVFITDQECTQ